MFSLGFTRAIVLNEVRQRVTVFHLFFLLWRIFGMSNFVDDNVGHFSVDVDWSVPFC